ncbi:MAG: AbrB/MazE/SpoVT family DNA-binding domain-containing protein [Mycobacteriales bacterium]
MTAEVKRGRSSRLSGKNQLTIPVAALRAAGMHSGDLLEVESAEPGRIVLRRWKSRFDGVTGTLPGLERDADIEASRDQWGT